MKNIEVTAGLTVAVLPNATHEFLMTTKEVALGYGVSPYAIRQSMFRNQSELIEGKHFIKGRDISLYPLKEGVSLSDTLGSNSQPHQIFWTKRGIVRLGFFIKSERAKLFRDWAEDLILTLDKQTDLFGERVEKKPLPGKRRHNRLTQERLVAILTDVAKIEDKNLRMGLVEKLTTLK